jgi:hypothetical protein
MRRTALRKVRSIEFRLHCDAGLESEACSCQRPINKLRVAALSAADCDRVPHSEKDDVDAAPCEAEKNGKTPAE